MKNEKVILLLMIFTLVGSGCVRSSHSKKVSYAIAYDDNSMSKKWAIYLHRHLKQREADCEFLLNKPKNDSQVIHISVSEDSSHDYCIEQTSEKISMTAKDEATMLWLIYQLISNLSLTDSKIHAEDIPPAIISMKTACVDFDFSYREPYYLPNLQFEYAPLIGTDMLETAWGLWGHGLDKVIQQEPASSVYAVQYGQEDKKQFCFSSVDLYRLTKSYILDNYGDGESLGYRFMIMPNDNKIVCTCPKCTALGNTQDNATPALSKFITRLAKSFPAHLFFTTAYLTTQTPPEVTWPDNTGVMVSTINLPKGIVLKPSKVLDEFTQMTNSWKQKVSHVYIWDYAANFDDWLTPLPTLYALQKQLQFFKKQEIEGVFLNGSGYDYSPFDDFKTHVSAALMMNVNASVDSLCKQYLTHYYPTSGEYLSNFYLFLEQSAQERDEPYEIYGNLGNSIVFANIEHFIDFYDGLESFVSQASGDEKSRLIQIQTALSFTRLQIGLSRAAGRYGLVKLEGHTMVPSPEIELYTERLKHSLGFADMKNYKEVDGLLSDFIVDMEARCSKPITNFLIGTPFEVMTKLDDDYRDIGVIQDGVFGSSNNYHYGWLLVSSESFKIQFKANENIQKGETLQLHFLNDRDHNILPPEQVLVYKNKELYAQLFPENDFKTAVVELSASLDLLDAETVMIEIINQQEKKSTMAFDEILIY